MPAKTFQPTRRFVLAASGLMALPRSFARADAPADPRMADRAEGDPAAPASVEEWFSLDCPHCARFARDIFPQIKEKLINTGKLHYVFRDYPLSQVALTAAMVARALPAERYEPFMMALFATQETWAFDKTRDYVEELAKMAALAGMSRELFDATVKDDSLRDAIVAKQTAADTELHITSTPSFVVASKTPGKNPAVSAGEKSFEEFAALVGLPVAAADVKK
jgi:protein-disulfide isomerase